ncbi:hypothetical protein EIP91_011769 [Steccherinum ochraceum]|uniref:NADP-dependent oxidoreductase domain-containing protein n=1 Tax=Steccherinum ochraceum TaxID=92696 RepID=A0A4R0RVQ5_9APHY|nr:hypothetical protein EIP91_011769 [Steccherinum ochraceum]
MTVFMGAGGKPQQRVVRGTPNPAPDYLTGQQEDYSKTAFPDSLSPLATSGFPTRRLGANGPLVSVVGYGAMGIGAYYGTTDEEAAMATLSRAADLGVTFWDTADTYGTSEAVLGKWFAKTGRRSEIFLATKSGAKDMTPGLTKHLFSSKPSHIRSRIENSLKDLQTDYIDLYYQHRVDPDVPIEIVLETLRPYVEKGTIRYVGLCECSVDVMTRAKAVPGVGEKIVACQMEFSPFEMAIEHTGLLKAARELGVSIVAYSPLGRGMMSGKYKSRADFEPTDLRQFIPRWSDDNFPHNLALVSKFQEVATKYSATTSQITLAWIMHRHPDMVPIPGSRDIARLEENAASAYVAIREEDMRVLDEVVAEADVKGARKPPMRLGANGPLVSAIGYGAMRLGFYAANSVEEESAMAILSRAADLGVTFWDTADRYGTCETILGKWFAKTSRRSEIFLATKSGSQDMTPGQTKHMFNSKPSHMRSRIENSLKELQTDYIDLYYQHRVDPDVPIEVVMETLRPYVEKGTIRYVGLCECSVDVLTRAKAVPGVGEKVVACQMEFSPFEVTIESTGLLKAARELGVSIVAYSPLGRGVMSGQYKSRADFGPNDLRQTIPRWSDENFPHNLALVAKFEEVATKYSITTSQLTLAWIMHRHPDMISLPGSRSIARLEENSASAYVKIKEEDMRVLDEAVAKADVKGARTYPMMDSLTNEDCIPLSEWKGE